MAEPHISEWYKGSLLEKGQGASKLVCCHGSLDHVYSLMPWGARRSPKCVIRVACYSTWYHTMPRNGVIGGHSQGMAGCSCGEERAQ